MKIEVCYFDFPPVGCGHSIIMLLKLSEILFYPMDLNIISLKETNGLQFKYNFERYNQEDATVRRYTEDTSFINNEYIIEDLLADVGDTLCTK